MVRQRFCSHQDTMASFCSDLPSKTNYSQTVVRFTGLRPFVEGINHKYFVYFIVDSLEEV